MPDLNTILLPQFLLKSFFLIILFLYAVFTFVVFHQTRVMNKVIQETHSSTFLAFITGFNLIAAISLFIYALVIL
ncbi:MAG: hypothetical protein HYV37_00410 [Candidatus Levyibacteriota bacterium]|nr:MAG: hypothetical protein HYV37_00410 [Candidatus Levybacteria bacterium]